VVKVLVRDRGGNHGRERGGDEDGDDDNNTRRLFMMLVCQAKGHFNI